MITPESITTLTEAEKLQADALEAHCDGIIGPASQLDPAQKDYVVDMGAYAKAAKKADKDFVLSIKVRANVATRYEEANWKVAYDVATSKLTFTMPKVKRTYKKRDPSPAVVVPPAEAA